MMLIKVKGVPYKTIGDLPAVGTKAPDFKLTKGDLSDFNFHDIHNKQVILNIFPSLDTATCAASVRRFNQIASQQPNTLVLCISMDLPFAQKRFCETEGLENVIPLSAFRSPDFTEKYGIRIVEGPLTGLLARSVIVIKDNGTVGYTQLVDEIINEPNYDDVLKYLKG